MVFQIVFVHKLLYFSIYSGRGFVLVVFHCDNLMIVYTLPAMNNG